MTTLDDRYKKCMRKGWSETCPIKFNPKALTFDEISEVLLSRSSILDPTFLYWMGMQLTSVFEEYESHNWNRCLFGGGLCPGIVVCAHPVQACIEREEEQKKGGK